MQSSEETAIQEVLQTERAWVDAHRRLDIPLLDRLMAEDYTAIQPDGTVIGKAQDLASYRSGNRHWEFAASDQYLLRVYGDTAVLVGRWRAKGTNAGVPFDYSARFTSVYVKRAGQWEMVLAQSTTIPER